MRPILMAIPSFLALGCAAGLWAVAVRMKSVQPSDLPYEPKHLISAGMQRGADAMKAKTAPRYSLVSVDGRKVSLGGKHERPQFVYFVEDGCPCSYAAEPLFHALAQQFHGKIDFVSVTNAQPEFAKKWVDEVQAPYPVVADPKVDIMKAYSATSSAYSALVSTDGKIEKMWPGFSRSLLLDMNQVMAKEVGERAMPFDTQNAPTKPATGCTF